MSQRVSNRCICKSEMHLPAQLNEFSLALSDALLIGSKVDARRAVEWHIVHWSYRLNFGRA